MRKIIRHAAFICGIALGVVLQPLRAQQDIPVPLHVQAQYFKKIFGYSQTLSNSANPFLAIVGYSDDFNSKVQAAFEKAGLSNSAVFTPEQFYDKAKSYEVVYMCPDASANVIQNLCLTNKILSITASSVFYDRGQASIALKIVDNKCQILIDMERLKKEGQRFSAAFLSLTKAK